MRTTAQAVGGKGGGRPDMAQGGGTDVCAGSGVERSDRVGRAAVGEALARVLLDGSEGRPLGED
ncbi:hypothetical protein UMZ34_18145 [Halopseudomonas pachastrellae]|nr:hypothetical protein UMZ34_18145 [Halopseudomonas pachastrellae]